MRQQAGPGTHHSPNLHSRKVIFSRKIVPFYKLRRAIFNAKTPLSVINCLDLGPRMKFSTLNFQFKKSKEIVNSPTERH